MNEVRRVGLRDIDLEYESTNSEEEGDTLLLVHGFTGSRDDFREQLPRLASRGRTIALDQRGHGGSSNTGRPESYSFEELVADLAAFIDDLEIDKVDLLGHSMGGMVAMRYALRYPERLRSLILMDTAPGPVQLMPKPLLDGAVKVARSLGMGTLADIMREGASKRDRGPGSAEASIERMGRDVYFARIKRKLEQMDVEAFDFLGALVGDHESVSSRIGEIRAQTLVIVGEEDALFRPGSDELAKGIPNARLEIIPGAAHSPQLENPDAWFEIVTGHLDRVRSPR
jgi:pimeloyl-ACP methyl ester carboxylesterase